MSSSSERDWRLYADDIVEACGKIRRFVAGMDYDAFVADERTRDALRQYPTLVFGGNMELGKHDHEDKDVVDR